MDTNATATSAGSRGFGRSFACALVSALVAIAAALSVFVASASATITHEPEPFSPITGAGSGVTLNELSGIAIDEANGNVFVTNAEANGPGQVAILGAEGGTPAELESPFAINSGSFESNTFYPLAYDNAAASPAQGTLYVSGPGRESIVKYVRKVPGRYEAEGAPISGLEEVRGASVDGEGNLWLGGGSGTEGGIYKVTPAGVVTEYEFDPTHDLYDQFELAEQTAVDDAGDLFFASVNAGVYECVPNLAGEITRERCSVLIPGGAYGVAVDRAHGDVYAALSDSVVEYDIATGKKISEFGQGRQTRQIAVNEAMGLIYVTEPGPAFHAQGHVNVYGPAVVAPTVAATAATNVTGTKATLNGTVNPEGEPIEECVFEWGSTTTYGHTSPCEGSLPADVEPHPVSLQVTGLEPNGATYHYRVVARNASGTSTSNDKTVTTAGTVITEPATGIGTATATLHGIVRPEGVGVSDCELEYKLVTEAGFTNRPCVPGAAEIEPDFTAHAVSLALTGLQPNGTYAFRLKVTDAEEVTRYGATLEFTTTGPPQLSEIRAVDATHEAVTLEAKVDPDGFGTSYRFEWGSTGSYGHSVPVEFEPYVGAGEQPVLVKAKLTGLSPETVYRYRIVATSSVGSTASAEQTLETLGSCGLPEGRCLELVSPRELGPIGAPGRFLSQTEVHFQASVSPGALAYTLEDGLPEATQSGEMLYLSARGAEGWQASQLAPGVREPSEKHRTGPSEFLGLSQDLSCSVVESNQLLTESPAARLVVESGGTNLYRRNPDGSYSLITDLAPENPEDVSAVSSYSLAGMSSTCGRVLFETDLRYPGVGGSGLYEWTEAGGLRDGGLVPNGSGGEVSSSGASGGGLHSVSQSGAHVFFSARRAAGEAGEVGDTGVFVREGGETRDVSLSQTVTPDSGAKYVGATPSGSHVYFTANAGLTAESSLTGTDLYEYDLETDALRDLSVTGEAGGAQIAGLLGVAEDGSHVYFAAQAQLVPGRGPSTSENGTAKTYSVYDATAGGLKFAGIVGQGEITGTATAGTQATWTSRVSPDGRYLLFETAAKVTSYESGGGTEAYLYDADATGESIVCVSCRQDGKASESASEPPLEAGTATNPLYEPLSLVEGEGDPGRPEVFFVSLDALAEGAVQGELNLYEWAHGQVFWIATEPGTGGGSHSRKVRFVGASSEGTDLYFFDAAALNWENPEGRYAAWDARIGGGFAEPPAPAKGCEATAEGSCQGAVAQAPASPSVGSASFSGPGNVAQAPQSAAGSQAKKKQAKTKKKSKKRRRKRAKQKAKKKAKKGRLTSRRKANGERRAGK
ncbi:MAG TPA: hypothetical protein VGF95_03405 [Solirubrobacteraceae bacterium]|jgi:hypothetical protein